MKAPLSEKNSHNIALGVKILSPVTDLETLMGVKPTFHEPDSNGVAYNMGDASVVVDGTSANLKFVEFYASHGQEYYRQWQRARLLVFSMDDEKSVAELHRHVEEWSRYGGNARNLFIVGIKDKLTKQSDLDVARKKIEEITGNTDSVVHFGEVDVNSSTQLHSLRKAIAVQVIENNKNSEIDDCFETTLSKETNKEMTAYYQIGMVLSSLARQKRLPYDVAGLFIEQLSATKDQALAMLAGLKNSIRIKSPFNYDAIVKIAKDFGGLKEAPKLKKGVSDYLEGSVTKTLAKPDHSVWKSHIHVKDVYEVYSHCNHKKLSKAGISDKASFVDKVREEQEKKKGITPQIVNL